MSYVHYPLPSKSRFSWPWESRLVKTWWEKEKLLWFLLFPKCSLHYQRALLLTDEYFLALYKLKEFTDELDITHNVKFVFHSGENIWGKGHNASYQHLLLFQQCFQKLKLCGKGLTFSLTSVCSISLWKTLWVKEKLLVMSNFSISHSVFYPFGELSAIFIKS